MTKARPLNDFITSINKQGVARSNRFKMSINLPADHYLKSVTKDVIDLTSIRCESVSIPEMNLATVEGPYRYGYGPLDRAPYAPIYNDVSTTFLVDRNTKIHKFFYDWVNTIVNFNNTNGLDSVNSTTGAKLYEVGYRRNFQAEITITSYDESDNRIMTAKLSKAYPQLVSQIDMSWRAESEPIMLVTTFTFKDFSIEYHQTSK
jgi:hypothetical protein